MRQAGVPVAGGVAEDHRSGAVQRRRCLSAACAFFGAGRPQALTRFMPPPSTPAPSLDPLCRPAHDAEARVGFDSPVAVGAQPVAWHHHAGIGDLGGTKRAQRRWRDERREQRRGTRRCARATGQHQRHRAAAGAEDRRPGVPHCGDIGDARRPARLPPAGRRVHHCRPTARKDSPSPSAACAVVVPMVPHAPPSVMRRGGGSSQFGIPIAGDSSRHGHRDRVRRRVCGVQGGTTNTMTS